MFSVKAKQAFQYVGNMSNYNIILEYLSVAVIILNAHCILSLTLYQQSSAQPSWNRAQRKRQTGFIFCTMKCTVTLFTGVVVSWVTVLVLLKATKLLGSNRWLPYSPSPPPPQLKEERRFSSVCSFQSAGSHGLHPTSLQSAGWTEGLCSTCHFLYNPAINFTRWKNKDFSQCNLNRKWFHFVKKHPHRLPGDPNDM